RLEALGYLGGVQSSEGERNLAAIAFEDGRYDDALEIYQRLIEADPEEPGLRTSLAGALGAMGDYEGALDQLESALALDPLNVEAYHNRAVIHERQGNPDLAIADYNTVLRYAPDYEPSRAALLRMTGSASANTPSSDAEQQASFIAEKASQAARRGDYETALTLLDHAETIAPQYSLVFQYRSNVAYLMGDRDAAIAALERALELEPDNALFRANLTRLQADSTERR
ncbi:MAG: tetratricopeptide repeat protein, partial [Thermoanaerobaculia bacterium]